MNKKDKEKNKMLLISDVLKYLSTSPNYNDLGVHSKSLCEQYFPNNVLLANTFEMYVIALNSLLFYKSDFESQLKKI